MAPVLVPRRIVQQQQEGLELLESELVVEVPLGPGLPHPDEPLPEGLELLESELVVEGGVCQGQPHSQLQPHTQLVCYTESGALVENM